MTHQFINPQVFVLSIDFFVNGLCTFVHEKKGDLIEIGQYHEATEKFWKEKDQDLQNQINVILDGVPPQDHDEVVSGFGWELHTHQYKYPSLHRESLVITLHNFLENSLNELCGILTESNQSELKLKHIHGSGIERSLLFLTKVSNFNLQDIQPELPFLKGVNLIRNQIVHNGGILPEDQNHKANRFVKNCGSLMGNPNAPIHVSSEFIDLQVSSMITFFEKLDTKIQHYISQYHERHPNEEDSS